MTDLSLVHSALWVDLSILWLAVGGCIDQRVHSLLYRAPAVLQIVRWRDVRRTKPSDPEDLIVASHVNLLPTEDSLTISDLVPGSQYQVRPLSTVPG